MIDYLKWADEYLEEHIKIKKLVAEKLEQRRKLTDATGIQELNAQITRLNSIARELKMNSEHLRKRGERYKGTFDIP